MDPILVVTMRKVWPFDSIIIATANEHKRKQFEDLFSPLGMQIKGLRDFKDVPEIVEDQSTFEGNATKKAEIISQWVGGPVISDDSGIVVPALGGEPGVFSARYAGEDATDEKNNQKLISKIREIPEQKRNAYYICMMAIAIPTEPTRLFRGECHGEVITTPRGSYGFGYDPIFYLPCEQMTMAEISSDRKYQISHRGKATAELVTWLKDYFTF
jgi:XTP/dITP diphosphohydrolase